MIGFIIARVIIVVSLIVISLCGAPDNHTLRFICSLLYRFGLFVIGAWGAVYASNIQRIGWALCFGIIAFLFNPLLPIAHLLCYLSQGIYDALHIVVILILIISLFLLQKTKPKEIEDKQNI